MIPNAPYYVVGEYIYYGKVTPKPPALPTINEHTVRELAK